MTVDPYLKTARFYDKFVEPFNKDLRKLCLRFCPPRQEERVLEVGCGTGSNLKLYREAGCRISGIDLSPSMMAEARAKLGTEADLRLGDASETSWPDSRFDLAIAMLTLHEMPAPVREAVLSEIARVMKKDGRVLLVDFNPGPLKFPKGWLYKTLILFLERMAGQEHFKNYRDFIARRGLLPLIKKCGFSIEKRKLIAGGNMALYLLGLD